MSFTTQHHYVIDSRMVKCSMCGEMVDPLKTRCYAATHEYVCDPCYDSFMCDIHEQVCDCCNRPAPDGLTEGFCDECLRDTQDAVRADLDAHRDHARECAL